ncbi:MAG TPA: carboxypeptidase regulatory-like domain-containing protein [Bryobacteraceae bacterium]|nr:carboxypeptidase regulatory-like domain-containing protein [Bryobacteraceae bacterium]
MSLTSPPLVKVNPGDPITSQQWNNIIDAIGALYNAFNTVMGSLDVTITDRGTNAVISGATVSVVPTGTTQGQPRAALFVGNGVNRYRLDQLPPGTYNVVSQADGYTDETDAVTMAADGSSQALKVQLTPSVQTIVTPVLLGLPLTQAIAALGTDLQIGRIIDSHGNDIPPAALTADAAQAFVLNQAPDAGIVVPKNTALFVQIAAKAEFTERVKVPDIRGLTIDNARAALAASQLVLGVTKNA